MRNRAMGMKRFKGSFIFLLALSGMAFAGEEPVTFTAEPNVISEKNGVRIEFAANRNTDVAVEILDKDGNIVRHLGAGVLGDNAPEPFKKGSLAQELVWDRKDDAGKAVAAGDYSVRVALGLKPEFDRIIGWNPRTVGQIKALAVDGKGNLYCLNGYSGAALQVFDRSGKYLRTILPHSPDQPAERLTGLKTLKRANGVRVPFLRNMRNPYPLAQVGIGGLRSWGSMAVTGDGKVLIAGLRGYRVVVLGCDGSIPKPMLGPAVMPKGSSGVKGLALSPDGKFIYAAGIGPKKCPVVYRTPLGEKAEEPRPFLGAEHSAPQEPASFKISKKDPWGIATDVEGRIYVCDPGNNRVAVFSSDGKFLASLKTPSPVRVAVHGKTGAIYVVSRREVRKLSGLKDTHAVWTLPLPKVPGGTPPVFVLDAGAQKPILWIGCPQQMNWAKYILWRVEDQGDSAGKSEEISDRARQGLFSPVHLTVDPKREEVYVREWRESRFVRFDGKTGKRHKLKLPGGEMAVGPDGLLYVRSYRGEAGSYISRHDHSGKCLPFPGPIPFPGNKKAFWVDGSGRGGTWVGARGLCVAPDGDIYILRYFSARGGRKPLMDKGHKFPKYDLGKALRPLVDVYGPDGRLKRAAVVKYFMQGACGVKVDRAGNIYVADNIKPKGKFYPTELESQLPKPGASRVWAWPYGRHNWYLFNYGALFKFPPAGGTISPVGAEEPGAQIAGGTAARWRYATVKGALWQYLGVSPVPAHTNLGHGGGCVCTNSRFDLDAFGRIFVPDVHRFCVDVLDSNANKITTFGRYGNADCRGPEITFNWGSFVGVSEQAVYICDNLNRRIVRVKLGYAVEKTCSATVKP
jgi:DNA-binding beta-propeller fold protein YncE